MRWLDADEDWYNCPLKFVNNSIYDFIMKYDSYKNGTATPPDFEMQSARFNQAVRFFDSKVSEFIEMKKGEK